MTTDISLFTDKKNKRMRRKKYKVGDRVFYENYKKELESAVILDIEEREMRTDKFGKALTGGRTFKYKLFKTGKCTFIEDYNCLSLNDPRVKEYCKGKKFITANFADELRKFLVEHGAHKGDNDVAQILYDLANEFE